MLAVKAVKYIDEFYELKGICWAGASDVLDLIEEEGLEEEAMQVINEYFDNEEEEIEETSLNDFIWFELEDVMKEYGYLTENDEEEEEPEEDEEEEDD